MATSAILSVGAIIFVRQSDTTSAILPQLILGIMSVLAGTIVLHRASGWKSVLRLLVALLVVAVYALFVFTGYGRLNLVALGLMALVLASTQAHSRLIKLAAIVTIGPALFLLSLMREQFALTTYRHSLSGIGSVVTPLRDFSSLIAMQDQLNEFGRGFEPFWATLTFWVPRALWPGKPVGFGSTLISLLHRDQMGTGNSSAALNQGEWFFAYGWFGIVAMVVVIGLFIRVLDGLFAHYINEALSSRRTLLMLLLVTSAVADIPNLMWVGTFGYVSRVMLRLVAIGVLLVGASGAPIFARAEEPKREKVSIGRRRVSPPTVAAAARGARGRRLGR